MSYQVFSKKIAQGELSNTEMESITGGMATLKADGNSSSGQTATEEIEFEGSTIFGSGGHYDHDEGVCYPD